MSKGKLFSSVVRLYNVVLDHESNSKGVGQYATQFANGKTNSSDEEGLNLLANEMTDSLSTLTNEELAQRVATNLGLSGDPEQRAIDYLVDKFEDNPDDRGVIVYKAVDFFSELTENPVFGALARAFNKLTEEFIESVFPEDGNVAKLIKSILKSDYELGNELTQWLEDLLEEYHSDSDHDEGGHDSDYDEGGHDSDEDGSEEGNGHHNGTGHDLSESELLSLIDDLIASEAPLDDGLLTLLTELSDNLSSEFESETDEGEGSDLVVDEESIEVTGVPPIEDVI